MARLARHDARPDGNVVRRVRGCARGRVVRGTVEGDGLDKDVGTGSVAKELEAVAAQRVVNLGWGRGCGWWWAKYARDFSATRMGRYGRFDGWVVCWVRGIDG